MCMRFSPLVPWHRWNWHGDEIIHDPIVPAARKLPAGYGARLERSSPQAPSGSGYPIDIRQFLSIESSAVVARELDKLRARLSVEGRERFGSRKPGSFDERCYAVVEWMHRFSHIPRRTARGQRVFDAWLFPEETLALRGGDCEDLSFLLAALLEASGISPECLRVALGAIHVRNGDRDEAHDHAWVMYLDERGTWEILEPLSMVKSSTARRRASVPAQRASRHAPGAPEVEYVPSFVLNRRHLWRVRSSGEARSLADVLKERLFWRAFDPSFAAEVHGGIIDEALGDGRLPFTAAEVRRIKRDSLWVDVNVLAYDPRDHFDFAYVRESWQRVERRLGGDLVDFALAAHAIGDFYAHTVYAEFAAHDENGKVELYDPSFDASQLAYDFAPYAPLPGAKPSVEKCSALWGGQLISGQWWRWYTTYPDSLEKNEPDLARRRCLPDHDLIAVDGSQRSSDPRHRYRENWSEQFGLRREAAVRHVRLAGRRWCDAQGR